MKEKLNYFGIAAFLFFLIIAGATNSALTGNILDFALGFCSGIFALVAFVCLKIFFEEEKEAE